MLAVIAPLLGAAERIDPETGLHTKPDPTQRRIDLTWMGVYVIYAPFVGSAAAAVIEAAARAAPLGWRLATLPWGVRLAGAVLVAELVAYVLHRAMHIVPPLWRLHAVHHTATDLRWWTAFRFHPAETVLMHVTPYAVAALVGFGTDVTVVHIVAVTVVTIFAHADVFLPGRVIATLIVTPGYHRTHHEIGRNDTNFALVVPLLDVLFRTAAFDHATPRCFGTLRESGQQKRAERERCDVGERAGDQCHRPVAQPAPDERRLEQQYRDLHDRECFRATSELTQQREDHQEREWVRQQVDQCAEDDRPLPRWCSATECTCQWTERCDVDRDLDRQREDQGLGVCPHASTPQ